MSKKNDPAEQFVRFFGTCGDLTAIERLPVDEKLEMANLLQHVLTVKLMMEKGGRVELSGFATPEDVARWRATGRRQDCRGQCAAQRGG